MGSFKDLPELRAEKAVLRALKSGRPQKFQPLLMGLYRKFAPVYYPKLAPTIVDALWRLQTMGRIKFTPGRKYQLVKFRKQPR
ncbi:MAG: hypothetical protein Q7S83_04120 [bacterium]|nr:hypothetical protein [bacterium]